MKIYYIGKDNIVSINSSDFKTMVIIFIIIIILIINLILIINGLSLIDNCMINNLNKHISGIELNLSCLT